MGNDDKPELQTMEVDHEIMSVKLAPFWIDNPQTWFDTAEYQFELAKIKSDSKKALYVITALTPEVSEKISDFIRKPPKENQYESIKATLIQRLALNDERKLELLLSGVDLGDMHPSELLQKIESLAGHNFNDFIIKTFWTRRLPEVLRITLMTQPDDAKLEALAKMADKIYDAMNRKPALAQITGPSSSSSFRPPLKNSCNTTNTNNNRPLSMQAIMQKLNAMEARLNHLSNQLGNNRGRSNSRNFNNGSYRNRSNSGNRNSNDRRNYNNYNKQWCYNHNKYKMRANNCKPPCNFSKTYKANVEQSSAQPKND